MSAIPKITSAFQLYKRSNDDVVKARPYSAEHDSLVDIAVALVGSKNEETVLELAKV